LIVFGTAVTDAKTYDRYAAPGIRRAAEEDSTVLAHKSAGSLFRNYNLLLDQAAAHDDLEALVLLHQDVEIADEDFVVTVRDALTDPDVAIVGCVGAVGVRGLAWWNGALTWAGVTHSYPEYGGGEFPAISWRPEAIPSWASTGEVDSIDGLVMVLSPWAVRELRFDESLGELHGYDFDICMQARAAGKKVATAPFRVIHHRSLELISDPEVWIQAYMRLGEKWREYLPDSGADPEHRALRAEAEAGCARAIMVSHQMREQAAKRELARVREELAQAREQAEEAAVEPKPATEAEPAQPPPAPAPPPAKRAAIDHAIENLGVESFASLEIGHAFGQYAIYAIDRPAVKRGFLLDVAAWRARDHLLSAIEHAAERPGMVVLDADFSDPQMVEEIAPVDAVLMFDVLHRMVAPDWDTVIELYAACTNSFVIGGPQWEGGEETVRLLDLGRERYLEVVPPSPSHNSLFDELERWHAGQPRLRRDGAHVWQWGITDADLEAKMDQLGFSLQRQRSLRSPARAEGFVNRTFVFGRAESAAGD
jgi:hypothetical protein